MNDWYFFFYFFCITSGLHYIHDSFTIKFRKELRKKLELKAVKAVAAIPCIGCKCITTQLHIHNRENNLFNVNQHLFHELLFACLFFFLTLTSL